MDKLTRTILIADREQHSRKQIRRYLEGKSGFQVVGECSSSLEAVRFIHALEPDILFLDVPLDRMSACQVIAQATYSPMVVFTAKNESFALKAFENNALDYLLKPYSRERFEATLQRLSFVSKTEALQISSSVCPVFLNNLFVDNGKRLKRIAVADIHYLKAARDYTVIHTSSGEYLSSLGIGHLEARLDPSMLRRVHRSFIVNLNYVEELYRDFGKMYIVMKNGHEIGVGRLYSDRLKTLIV